MMAKVPHQLSAQHEHSDLLHYLEKRLSSPLELIEIYYEWLEV